MKLYIKQRVFSWTDRFTIYDESLNGRYDVVGEILTLGKKLHLYDPEGLELAYIHQILFSFLPRYFISRDGVDIAEVVKDISFFTQHYRVEGLGWTVDGDFFNHKYVIRCGDRIIAAISKRWISWGDTYEIDIASDEDEIMALCVVLIIDAVLARIERKRRNNFKLID